MTRVSSRARTSRSVGAGPKGGGHPWARKQTAELVELGARLIVVTGTIWRAVREVTDTTPIVTNNVEGESLPGLGYAATMARPGGNLTGLSHAGPQVTRKLIELLVVISPGLKRLAVMTNVDSAPDKEAQVRAAAGQFNLELVTLDIRAAADVAAAFERAQAWGAQALTVDGLVPVAPLKPVVPTFAARYRVPTIYYHEQFVEAGGLMSYALGHPDGYAMRRVAWYVARILEGTLPGALPLEMPTLISFTVNRSALANLGISLSTELAAQVTRWID